jgi:hypothetical protein
LFQIALSAALTPLSIYFTQRIIDEVSGIINKVDGLNGLFLWVSLPMFSLLLKSEGEYARLYYEQEMWQRK